MDCRSPQSRSYPRFSAAYGRPRYANAILGWAAYPLWTIMELTRFKRVLEANSSGLSPARTGPSILMGLCRMTTERNLPQVEADFYRNAPQFEVHFTDAPQPGQTGLPSWGACRSTLFLPPQISGGHISLTLT